MISGTFKCTLLKGNILCSSFMQNDIDCKKPRQSKQPSNECFSLRARIFKNC